MPPLVVLALDSADPDLLLAWTADGTLPALASLVARGAHARLEGPEMVSAHGVWPSLWSGLSLARHGRYLRKPLRPGSYELLDEATARRAAPPFWSALPGRRVTILDAPDAPPVAGIAGVQLLDWGTHPSSPQALSEPPNVVAEIERRFGPRILSDEIQGTRSGDAGIYRRLLERIARQGELARHLLRDPFDLAVIGFGDAHAAGHRFWRYRPDAGEGRTPDPELGGAVREVYRALDAEVGRILSAVPGEPHVVVLTDHGIREGYPTWELMSAFCHRLGYQARRDTGALEAMRRAARAQWRRVRSRIGRASGALDAQALAATDWHRTRAFPIPAHYTGLIRVNLRDREPNGIVRTADYVALLDGLEADLRRVVDSGTGQPAVERITRSVDVFGGGPPRTLPDLFVEWRVLRSRHLVHPKATLNTRWLGLPRPNLHSRTGLVLAAGPSLGARGDRGGLAPSDVAPLLLSLVGERPRANASSRALEVFAVGLAS
jgi:predicted AlkP superfamily phosphohydrolase/phosphomutase